MVANLIVHAGDANALALQSMQPAVLNSNGKLRDGAADGAAAGWMSSPDSNSRRQPRSQGPQQVTSVLLGTLSVPPAPRCVRHTIRLLGHGCQ